MEQFPGFGKRLKHAFHDAGYGKESEIGVDVLRFCKERGYIANDVYRWLKGRLPEYENRERLEKDLGVSMVYLLHGEETSHRKAKPRRALRSLLLVAALLAGGVPGRAEPSPVGCHPSDYFLSEAGGRWWRRRFWSVPCLAVA